jgi:hypothetical protein
MRMALSLGRRTGVEIAVRWFPMLNAIDRRSEKVAIGDVDEIISYPAAAGVRGGCLGGRKSTLDVERRISKG